MTKLSSTVLVLLCVAGVLSPAHAASRTEGAQATVADVEGAKSTCRYTLAQYTDYAKQLALFASKSRARADENPIYLSDVAYYDAELASAKDCIRALTPFTSASR